MPADGAEPTLCLALPPWGSRRRSRCRGTSSPLLAGQTSLQPSLSSVRVRARGGRWRWRSGVLSGLSHLSTSTKLDHVQGAILARDEMSAWKKNNLARFAQAEYTLCAREVVRLGCLSV